jgi:N-formylglutamate deformylase
LGEHMNSEDGDDSVRARFAGLGQVSLPGVLTRSGPMGPARPVVLDSPHSGCDYPEDFGSLVPLGMLRRAEDMYVGELFANAPLFGATLIEAHFPRSYIDPNRALDDLDPDLLADDWPETVEMGEKARLGHGLIWRFCPPDLLLYRERLSAAVVQERIAGYWHPYHACLGATIGHLQRQFGRVWHINCHSMPAASGPGMGYGDNRKRADFVLGDRDGTSCSRELRMLIAETLQSLGYAVALNDPYKGVELVRAFSDPDAGRHSIQIEINRSLYMNERTLEKHSGFATLKADLDHLVSVIAEVAVEAMPAAAE